MSRTPFTTGVPAEQLAEAHDAATAATTRYPTLGPNGLRANDCTLHYDAGYMQIATALAFLRCCARTKRATTNSYWLKHTAERWGEGCGLSSYISNGALIAAAVYLDFTIQRCRSSFGRPVLDSPNVFIGISNRSLRALRALVEHRG